MSGYEFKVWVGCLACYNNGNLNGGWRDPAEGVDWKCSNPTHEETWVFDTDTDIPALQREMSPSEAEDIAIALDACEANFHPAKAYALWCANVGEKIADYVDNQDSFEESYRGDWGSLREYAEDLFDDCYAHSIPEELRGYIDYEAFARDLDCEGYWEEDGYVFGP